MQPKSRRIESTLDAIASNFSQYSRNAVAEHGACSMQAPVSLKAVESSRYFAATIIAEVEMTEPGSGGNVLAALCSFFVPGLGQLLQARLGKAFLHFILSILLWFVLLGWVMHIWSAYEAANFKIGT